MESKICTRCGVETEQYSNWVSKIKETTLCSDCCIDLVSVALNHELINITFISDFAERKLV